MDHAENTLRASVKALTDVVMPAIDPADAQALDQLRLVIAGLDFLGERLNLLPDRERFELDHNLALARALLAAGAAVSAIPRSPLDEAIVIGAEVSGNSHATGAAVRAASTGLAAAVCDFVRHAAHADRAARHRIDLCVIAASRQWAAVDRAWYLPLGFDPEPATVNPVEVMMASQSVTHHEEKAC